MTLRGRAGKALEVAKRALKRREGKIKWKQSEGNLAIQKESLESTLIEP